MNQNELNDRLRALDPDSTTSTLDPAIRQELFRQRPPSPDELEPGETWDPQTQAFSDPEWTPSPWSGAEPLSEEALEEINNSSD